jgi:transposase
MAPRRRVAYEVSIVANIRRFPENSVEELRAALERARTKEQFQRVQCLWLRAALGLSAQQVATALGWTLCAVYKHQWRYLKKGAAMLEAERRGGRRYSVFSRRKEKALLDGLRIEAWPDQTIDFSTVHRAVEEAAGRPVHTWTVRRMLDRHHWRLHALAIGPWRPIPQSAVDAFRKHHAAELPDSLTGGAVRYLVPQDSDAKS